jgi:hypothetical protein
MTEAMMRHARRYVPLILTCFMAGCVTPSKNSGLSTDATVIDLPGAVHFRTPEDADQTVEAGPYRVERAEPGGLRLKELDGSRALTLKAETVTHDFELRGPLALTAPEGEDTQHIALLFPGGQALNAVGSLSGVQSRATAPTAMSRMAMQQSVQVLRPSKLALFATVPPDPCAGAIPSLPAPPPAPTNLPQITPGQGPIADVVDWQPKQKSPAGRELVIQGRNFDPSGLVATIGSTRLLPTTKSASEARFTIPASLRAFNAPLVVYQQGGTPRTIEISYEVYDPIPVITRVVPDTFSEGDLVTVCGVSVSHIDLVNSVGTGWSGNTHLSETRKLLRIGANPQRFPNSPSRLVETLNPVGSPSGDRLTFAAGPLYKDYMDLGSNPNDNIYALTIVRDTVPPATVTAPFQFRSEASSSTNLDLQSSGPVTWRLGGPKIVKAGMHPNSQFTLNEPFLIQPAILPNNTPYAGYGVGRYFVVEGFNLQGQYRLGTVSIPQLSLLSNDYTKIGVSPPPTATGGQLCGTSNGITNCAPQSLMIVPGPVLATIPNAPLALRATHIINGLHLLPAGVPGLTYELYITGLMDPNLQIAGGSAPTIGQCNLAVQVLEHTATRIQFRIGDPNGPAPSSACLTFRADFFNPASPNRPTVFLLGKYNGKQLTVWHQQIHLSQ